MLSFSRHLACLFVFIFSPLTFAQEAPEPRVVIANSTSAAAGVFLIAPITSWSGTIQLAGSDREPTSVTPKLKTWIASVEALNGLSAPGMKPWHAVISYELFDRDGDHEHSGTIDEVWVSPKQYRITYESDNLHQTDIATESGLFRTGDQRFPTPAEIAARVEALEPFNYGASLFGFDPHPTQIMSGSYKLDCTALNRAKAASIGDTQYCFDPVTHALRYSHTSSWTQTAFNAVGFFQDRYVARDVVVTDGGHPSMILHIATLETLPVIGPGIFTPAAGATLISGQRLSGVRLKPTHTEFPEWPSGIKESSFKVTVEIVVGKDGRVISAHAMSGPDKALKAAEKTAMKWRFDPYLVLGQPSEVETKIELSQN